MNGFEYLTPASLGEALALLDPEDRSVRPLSGGTALMLMMKAGMYRPRRLVSLRRIGGALRDIGTDASGAVVIGALAPLAAVERSALVRRELPVLTRTLLTLANVRVRQVATLGGHLAHADPHTDLPPLLTALGASLAIAGPQGERRIAVEELATGYMETRLRANELITAVTIPASAARRAAYIKYTSRSADDWPAVGLAVSLELDGGAIRSARVVLGAATDRPTRLGEAESVLRGARPDDAALRRAGEAAVAGLEIAGDHHGSAAYKKHLAAVLLARAVRAALA